MEFLESYAELIFGGALLAMAYFLFCASRRAQKAEKELKKFKSNLPDEQVCAQEILVGEEIKRILEGTENVGIILFDAANKIKLWNKAAEKIFGLEKSNFVEKVYEITNGQSKGSSNEKDYRRVQNLARAFKSFEINVSGKGKEARPLSVTTASLRNDDNQISSTVAIIVDNTERDKLREQIEQTKQATEKKFEQIRRLTHITEKINVGFALEEVLKFIYDSFRVLIPYDRIGFSLLEEDGETLRAKWVKSEAQKISLGLGYSAKIKDTSIERVIKTGQPRIIENLELYLERHPRSEATRLIVDEGMRSSLTCPLIVDQKVIGVLFFSSFRVGTYNNAHVDTFLQISRQLAVVAERGRLYERLIQLNDIKNKFIGIAAHDLRGPLVVVQAYLDLLLDGLLGELSEKQREVMHSSRKSCERMFKLIDDLLDVSMIESGKLQLKKEETDLNEFLRQSHEEDKVFASTKSIDFRLEIIEELPSAWIDKERLNQVIQNLVTNAVKFSEPNTQVIMRASFDEKYFHIAIVDQGQGIQEGEMEKLFQFFGRTSTASTRGEMSTGLGLAIAKRIVEAHKGSIQVESKKDVGTMFTVSLPLSDVSQSSISMEDILADRGTHI